jgi:carboxyl-terminal processing protease
MPASSRRAALLVLLVILGCGFLGVVFGQRLRTAPPVDTDVRESLQKFTHVYDLVEQNYAEPVSPDKAVYNGAIPGMLRTLDPHSNFFDPHAYSLLQEDQQGRYYGVGMQIAVRDEQIIVVRIFEGSPAQRAGLRPGDVITLAAGQSTAGMGTDEVANLLKGPKGTTVRIVVAREGAEKPLQFTVTRDEIPRYSVDVHFLIRPRIGYVHLVGFSETTDQELGRALDALGPVDGLVLDLRQNPGGSLAAAVGVADKFLRKGSVIVSQYGRSSPERVYRATQGNGGKEYPLVVLVNRGTASAAEIVAGAIQDHDRGLIAGENTFGKGLVQTIFPLSENTGLALTTAKYYTPSGRLIQRQYNGISLYDYYIHREGENNGPREVKMTESGRPVYGGDGITPDVQIPSPKATPFQDLLVRRFAFFNFARHYLVNHRVTAGLQVDEPLLLDFRRFLDEEKIPHTEVEIAQVSDWLRSSIKAELLTSELGPNAGLLARAESDPAIAQAVELLPQAKELAEKARKIVAQRDKLVVSR